jgi:ubiquinone/menaquinone biosynthesis C-methylase UbiE
MRFDHFNWLAPFYDRAIRDFSSLETMLKLAELPTTGALLEVGGGTGRVAAALQGQAKQIVVADLSLGMLRQAASKDGLALACTRSESLPFQEATFERIVMVDALHHVIDQKATVGELWRALKPRGRIVIQEPDVRRFSVKLVALFEKLALMRSHFLTPAHIAGLFTFDGARTQVINEDYSAWIVVGKR